MAEWTPERIDRAMLLVVQAALLKARCPMSNPHGPLESGAIEKLISLGLIRSEVSGRNYRQVFILRGEHAGRATAPNPHGHAAYKINGRHVDRIRHSGVRAGSSG